MDKEDSQKVDQWLESNEGKRYTNNLKFAAEPFDFDKALGCLIWLEVAELNPTMKLDRKDFGEVKKTLNDAMQRLRHV